MRFLALFLFSFCLAPAFEALASSSFEDELCRRLLQKKSPGAPPGEDIDEDTMVGATTAQMQAFLKFVDKYVAPSMDPTQRLRYDYLKRQSPNLLSLSVLNKLPRILDQQNQARALPEIPKAIIETANHMIEGIYFQAGPRRQYWMSTFQLQKTFNTGGNPSVKTLTEWMVLDLPDLSPVEQLRLLIHSTVGMHADFAVPDDTPLEYAPRELLTILDHPAFQAWLEEGERFSWLKNTPVEIQEMLYPGLSDSVATAILPIVVGLSRTKGGRKLAASLVSSPLFQGEDTPLALEWLRIHENQTFNEEAFLTLGAIRQKLDDQGTDIVVRTFFTSDIALRTEVANRMREYSLHEMPVDTPNAKRQRSWVWVAAYDFAEDFFNPSMISEGLFENDSGFSKTSALAFLNRSIRYREPIDTPFLKRIMEIYPEHFTRPHGQKVALSSFTPKDFPWLLEHSSLVPPTLLPHFLAKAIPEIAEAPAAEPFVRVRWEPKQLKALLLEIDQKRGSPDLVAMSIYWLAQTIRLRPEHTLRVFDWLTSPGQRHRLAAKVQEVLVANIGFKRLLEAVSKGLSLDRLKAFDRLFKELISEPANKEKFIAMLCSRAEEVSEKQRLPFLEFIVSVIEKYGSWPHVISGLATAEVRDSSTYTAASAVYLSKETGNRGLRNAQVRAVFEEGVALGDPFAALVPQKNTQRNRPEISAASSNQTPAEKSSETTKALSKAAGYSNREIVSADKSTAELLEILRNTQKSYVALSAVTLVLERNQTTPQDFGTPAEFSQLLEFAKWHLSARNHSEVAERLFDLVTLIVEQQFLFELDETTFKSWSEYFLAYTKQYPVKLANAEALLRWLESVSKQESMRLLAVLQAPLKAELSEPPKEPYLNYLSSWFQAKASAKHSGQIGFAAAIVSPAFMSPALSADIKRAAFYWRDQARPELYDLLISLKAPALYPISRLIVKGHAHFSFSRLKSESGLLAHAVKLRAAKKELLKQFGPRLPASAEEKQQRLNEELAMVATLLHELKSGRIPWEVDGLTELGYDVLSLDPLTGEVRRIEVKSGYGEGPIAHISNNELAVCALTQTEGAMDYYFYLVDTRRALSPDEPVAAIKFIKNPVVSELRALSQLDDSVPREKLLRFAVQE